MSLDPFESAFNESETPPDSPIPSPSNSEAPPAAFAPPSATTDASKDDNEKEEAESQSQATEATPAEAAKAKEEDDDEEENVDVELGKYQSDDPDKTERFTAILAQFTPEQMERYESFRRSGFQKANMRRLLQSIAGCPVSLPMTIVMSGVAKMFVGELVETARIVMAERKESGPVRPCHLREAYRRLKLEGKVPKRSRSRLFL
uniref:TSA: Wollemia nobilis Ref_Wollemi_Transcript_2062_976 transcribed RNA sequence n=1 Tax=Wollemia nobilis TaxID=56998 RepID=A0A0C9QX32_9CONI